jgi:hypothetical protein
MYVSCVSTSHGQNAGQNSYQKDSLITWIEGVWEQGAKENIWS